MTDLVICNISTIFTEILLYFFEGLREGGMGPWIQSTIFLSYQTKPPLGPSIFFGSNANQLGATAAGKQNAFRKKFENQS